MCNSYVQWKPQINLLQSIPLGSWKMGKLVKGENCDHFYRVILFYTFSIHLKRLTVVTVVYLSILEYHMCKLQNHNVNLLGYVLFHIGLICLLLRLRQKILQWHWVFFFLKTSNAYVVSQWQYEYLFSDNPFQNCMKIKSNTHNIVWYFASNFTILLYILAV